MAATAAHVLTVVDVFFVVDIHLHQPDQHARQNTQEVQVCSCLTHLTVERTTRNEYKDAAQHEIQFGEKKEIKTESTCGGPLSSSLRG